ncbi:hypothetical protein B0J14DRAFT_687711 [Halenospora varia]|nr:hypothetical protein B0J14DRAFT_687711 [Halenospora varia]
MFTARDILSHSTISCKKRLFPDIILVTDMEVTRPANLETSRLTTPFPSYSEPQAMAQPPLRALPRAQPLDEPKPIERSSTSGLRKWTMWWGPLSYCCASFPVDIPAPATALARIPASKCSICRCTCCNLFKGIGTKHCSDWGIVQMQNAERRERDEAWLRELKRIQTEQEQFAVGEESGSEFEEDMEGGLGIKLREVSPRLVDEVKEKRPRRFSNLDLESSSFEGSDRASTKGVKFLPDAPPASLEHVSPTREQKGKWKEQDGDAISDVSLTDIQATQTDVADYVNNTDVDEFVLDGSHTKTDHPLPTPESYLEQIAEEDDDEVQRQDERDIDEMFNRHANQWPSAGAQIDDTTDDGLTDDDYEARTADEARIDAMFGPNRPAFPAPLLDNTMLTEDEEEKGKKEA